MYMIRLPYSPFPGYALCSGTLWSARGHGCFLTSGTKQLAAEGKNIKNHFSTGRTASAVSISLEQRRTTKKRAEDIFKTAYR
jgi:hypothetical protein